ncbi:hypothetical protein J7M07_09110 [bacterium]|nr:hypothetical protein [bacterium]
MKLFVRYLSGFFLVLLLIPNILFGADEGVIAQKSGSSELLLSNVDPDRKNLERNSEINALDNGHKTMTIKGESLIRIEFERPLLDLKIDPFSVEELGWRHSWESVDFLPYVMNQSAFRRPNFLARPGMDSFVSGKVAVFRPGAKDSDGWQLTVVNSRGKIVGKYKGEGACPEEIKWDGLSLSGKPVDPGLTYSYELKAFDRAGNMRRYIGEGFEISPFIVGTTVGTAFVFSAKGLSGEEYEKSKGASKILIEVASRLNQMDLLGRDIMVETRARSESLAQSLAEETVNVLKCAIAGDPSRIKSSFAGEMDASDYGSVIVTLVGR